MPKAELNIRLIAADDHSRRQGLMHASPLSKGEVAFFVFPHMERHSFWNRNVSFDLSLAFLDDNGVVVDILDMDAYDEHGHAPNSPSRFVIEASKGEFDQLGIKIGDVVEFDQTRQTLKVG
jgi:uncharacterized membrane protein (UPF0127 family)